MRRATVLLLLLGWGILLTAQVNAAETKKAPRAKKAPQAKKADGDKGEWKLVWSDEFDTPGLPDPKKWDYEEGFIRNQEAQYYTREKENARVEKGMLVIEARKERVKNPLYRAGTKDWQHSREYAEYTAASLNTKQIAAWTYGRVEVRAKLPNGGGTWPAIWMLGVKKPWPANGEIDIMEWWSRTPETSFSTTHFSIAGKHKSDQGKIKLDKLTEGFHVYGLEWTPDRLDYTFDGKVFHSFPTEKAVDGTFNPFQQPHYLLINLALGGASGGKIDDSKLPQQYLIDYVRVYQKK